MDNLPKTMPRRGSFAQRLTQATRNVMRSGSVDNLSGTIAGINIDNQSNSDPHHSITNNPNDFEIGDAIGYGSSATVHMALHKPTGTNVAIKIIDLDMFERNQIDELRASIIHSYEFIITYIVS